VNCTEVDTPAFSRRFVFGIRAGKFLGAAAAPPPPNTSMGRPPHSRPMLARTNEQPSAVTSTVNLGEWRSGR
jgi:hypothetical protein